MPKESDDVMHSFACVCVGFGGVPGSRRVPGRAVGRKKLQHARPSVAEVLNCARRHDTDIAIADVGFEIGDLGDTATGSEVKQVFEPFVHLAADLTPSGIAINTSCVLSPVQITSRNSSLSRARLPMANEGF